MSRLVTRLATLAAVAALPAFVVVPAARAEDAKPAAAPAAEKPAAAPSVLTPAKGWFAPGQPIEVKVAADGPVTLVLTEFTGSKVDARESAEVDKADTKDLRKVFPTVDTPGAYILYAVPKGKDLAAFVGTPLVIGARSERRMQGAQTPMVTRVEPLRYAVLTSSKGPMTMAFYYDVAPQTADNFLNLGAEGYYDGLTFHRIKPGFVIQGGDPRGDGMGGPGYQIQAEFNDRPHSEGVLSMARSMDPNSAGSQFFVCLDYKQTAQLDKQYTTFGRVVDGMDAVKAIAAVATSPENDRPLQPVKIDKVEVRNVTAAANPYPQMQKMLQAK